jgi:hypothetical protein
LLRRLVHDLRVGRPQLPAAAAARARAFRLAAVAAPPTLGRRYRFRNTALAAAVVAVFGVVVVVVVVNAELALELLQHLRQALVGALQKVHHWRP